MATREPRPSRHQNAITAATQALTDATAALGEALRSASSQAAANAVEAATAAIEANAIAAAAAATRGVESAAATISSRSERRRATRANLLDSAVTVFAERGYEGTSVDDVAMHAGYTKGAVYSHFTSKAALFLAIFAESEALSSEALAAAGMHPRTSEHTSDLHDDLAVDPCILLTHELMLFGLRNPEHRTTAAELLSRTLEDTAAASNNLTNPTPEQHQATLDTLVTASALRHTISLLHALGVPEVNERAARRMLGEQAPDPR